MSLHQKAALARLGHPFPVRSSLHTTERLRKRPKRPKPLPCCKARARVDDLSPSHPLALDGQKSAPSVVREQTNQVLGSGVKYECTAMR